jgi:putative ABC transport system permease protein
MGTLVHDLKHTVRMLRRSPGFTVTAIAALALGIGANTAIFSVVNAVLLKPLPYPDPDRIVQLMGVTPQGNFSAASVPMYNAWRAQTQALEDVAAYDTGGPGVNIAGGDRPEQVKGIHASHQFFRLFGVPITLGRAFTADEDRPRGPRLVLISDGLWHRRFGADPNIAGKPISLGREPYTILGVLGPGFSFGSSASPDLLLPFQADPDSTQQVLYFSAAARLKPGIGVAAANAALDLTAQEFKRKFPGTLGPKTTFGVQLMQETVVHDVKTALYILLGAVGFVLLIACANVANLQLARASVRSREIAIRAAIGAGRARIIRQLLTESVVLAACGGTLGLILGFAGVRALVAVNPGDLPRIGVDGAGITLDLRVLAFTLALSIVTGIVFGLFPAIQASRADLHSTLKETGSRSGTTLRQNKSRAVLVVVEMALAIVLLVGAGLLIRTFAALHNVAPGFDANGVLTMETSLTGGRYDQTAVLADLARQAEERIEAIPGVEAAAASSYLPLEGGLGLGFSIEGRPAADAPSSGGAGWAYVTYRFFDVFKIALVRGRKFTDRDTASSPGVVIVNESFARKYWPGGNPVGQRITIGSGPVFGEPAREIVGVVADLRDAGLNQDPQPEMFVPLSQVRDAVMALNNRFMPLTWMVRSSVAPFSLSGPISAVFQQLADMPVAHMRTMAQVVVHSTASNRFNTLVLAVFAFVAILLASLGLYGLMAYSVEQRRQEFGIRLALGADRPALRNMVVSQAMRLAMVGILIGLAAAFGLTRLMGTMLYGVKVTDAPVFATAALLLAVVALLASYLPARRAIGVDPAIALRYE